MDQAQAKEQVPDYSYGQQSLCNCSHIYVNEQHGVQQDPITDDHLDNMKAEILTGMAAMWAISFPEVTSPGHHLLFLILIYPNSSSKLNYALLHYIW